MEARYIDHMGSDLRVVNAARVSFNKHQEVFDEERDTKLIKYLARNGHWTPFSHPMITLYEKIPIFVARQRFKHMVGFTYNEVSRRYVDDPPEFYIPDAWRARAENKKQGSDETKEIKRIEGSLSYYPFAHSSKKSHLVKIGRRKVGHYNPSKDYEILCNISKDLYNHFVDGGVTPEQARIVLPQSMYTEYYVTGSLAAWARAYKLRTGTDAQKEIRDLADMWNTIIRPLFPVSWEALTSDGQV